MTEQIVIKPNLEDLDNGKYSSREEIFEAIADWYITKGIITEEKRDEAIQIISQSKMRGIAHLVRNLIGTAVFGTVAILAPQTHPALAEDTINIADRGEVGLPEGFYQRATLPRVCSPEFKRQNPEFCSREDLLMIKSEESDLAFVLVSSLNGEVTLQILGEEDNEDLFDPIRETLKPL